MGSIRRRVEHLEGGAPGTWTIPIEVRVLLKAQARDLARMRGEEIPPYTPEELEHLREADLATAVGADLEEYRDDPGWQDEEAQRLLDDWQEDARRGLEWVEDNPERWQEVYEAE